MVQLGAQDFNHDRQHSLLSQPLTIESSTSHVLTQTFRHWLSSSSIYFLFHVSHHFLILGQSESHHTVKVLKQCYSNFVIVTSILVKLHCLFSLLALVPNSIMGQVRCIPKLSTVSSVHFPITRKPEDKMTFSVARNTTSCFLFPLPTHLTTFSNLYFKNHKERNAFMDTGGKC